MFYCFVPELSWHYSCWQFHRFTLTAASIIIISCFRCWSAEHLSLLSSDQRTIIVSVSRSIRQWHLWAGQAGTLAQVNIIWNSFSNYFMFPPLQILVSVQVWESLWHWSPSPGLTLLQAPIPQHSRLRPRHWRHHSLPGLPLLQTQVTGHWQVWRHWQWSPPPGLATPRPQEVVSARMSAGGWPGGAGSVARLLSPAPAQHDGVRGEPPDCEHGQQTTETLLHREFISLIIIIMTIQTQLTCDICLISVIKKSLCHLIKVLFSHHQIWSNLVAECVSVDDHNRNGRKDTRHTDPAVKIFVFWKYSFGNISPDARFSWL